VLSQCNQTRRPTRIQFGVRNLSRQAPDRMPNSNVVRAIVSFPKCNVISEKIKSEYFRACPAPFVIHRVDSLLSGSDRFLNIMHRMTGKVLGDLAAKNFQELLVVALAKFAKGARSGDNDEI
jgi:hypothetical protein